MKLFIFLFFLNECQAEDSKTHFTQSRISLIHNEKFLFVICTQCLLYKLNNELMDDISTVAIYHQALGKTDNIGI